MDFHSKRIRATCLQTLVARFFYFALATLSFVGAIGIAKNAHATPLYNRTAAGLCTKCAVGDTGSSPLVTPPLNAKNFDMIQGTVKSLRKNTETHSGPKSGRTIGATKKQSAYEKCEQIVHSNECQALYAKIQKNGHKPKQYERICNEDAEQKIDYEFKGTAAGEKKAIWDFASLILVPWQAYKAYERDEHCPMKMKKLLFYAYNEKLPKDLQVKLPNKKWFESESCSEVQGYIQMTGTRLYTTKLSKEGVKFRSVGNEMPDDVASIINGYYHNAKNWLKAQDIKLKCYNTEKRNELIKYAMTTILLNVATDGIVDEAKVAAGLAKATDTAEVTATATEVTETADYVLPPEQSPTEELSPQPHLSETERQRLITHFREHIAPAGETTKEAAEKIERARVAQINQEIAKITLDKNTAKSVLATLSYKYGEIFNFQEDAMGGSSITIDRERLERSVKSCLSRSAEQLCSDWIKRHLCTVIFSNDSSNITACFRDGISDYMAKHPADHDIHSTREIVQTLNNEIEKSAEQQVNKSKSRILQKYWKSNRTLSLRDRKMTSLWPEDKLNNFLHEHVDPKTFRLINVDTNSMKSTIQISRDSRISEGAIREYEIPFEDYRVKVTICERVPCPSGAEPGQVLSIYPKCGPDVYTLPSLIDLKSYSITPCGGIENAAKSVDKSLAVKTRYSQRKMRILDKLTEYGIISKADRTQLLETGDTRKFQYLLLDGKISKQEYDEILQSFKKLNVGQPAGPAKIIEFHPKNFSLNRTIKLVVQERELETAGINDKMIALFDPATKEAIASLDYQLNDGVVHINMIRVQNQYQTFGYAEALFEQALKANPEARSFSAELEGTNKEILEHALKRYPLEEAVKKTPAYKSSIRMGYTKISIKLQTQRLYKGLTYGEYPEYIFTGTRP